MEPRHRQLAFLIVVPLALLAPAGARASCGGDAPWVYVRVSDAWPAELRASILADLRAELDPLGIAACDTAEADPASALAEVRLDRSESEVVNVVIEVHDAVTDKRVGRDIAWSEIPEAGRSLTIALAAVELLRASWIELRLRSAPEPARAVPEVVEEVVERDVEPTEAPPPPSGPAENGLSLSAVFEHSIGGLTQLGAALRYQRWLVDAFAVGVRVGGRYGLPLASAQGRIDTSVLSAGIDLRFAITPRDELVYLGLELSALLMVVRFDGQGGAGVTGIDATDVALSVRAGVLGRIRLADVLSLEAVIGAGVPVVGLVATDGEGPVGGVETFEITVMLGPVLEL